MAKEKKYTTPREKICPLSRVNSYYGGNCQKELCAWWDDITGFCAITVIARFGSHGSFYHNRQKQKEALDSARGK